MRAMLRKALKQAFEKIYPHPFAFGTGFLEEINGGAYTLPCIWVCPFELAGKTGRSEGTKTYVGTICLLEPSEGLSPEEKDDMWDIMEQSALDVLSDMLETVDEVVAFEKIKCIPDEGAYTGFNDISQKLTFEVTLKYCEDRG